MAKVMWRPTAGAATIEPNGAELALGIVNRSGYCHWMSSGGGAAMGLLEPLLLEPPRSEKLCASASTFQANLQSAASCCTGRFRCAPDHQFATSYPTSPAVRTMAPAPNRAAAMLGRQLAPSRTTTIGRSEASRRLTTSGLADCA